MRSSRPPRYVPSASVLAVAALLCLAVPAARGQVGSAAPRRVVLFVADGAGVAQWSAGRLAAGGLAVDSFPTMGLIDPRNTSSPLPESGSSATAFATGVETFYHAIGVGPDSEPRSTVLEVAAREGLATGLVTTTLITDATPAAFAAHVVERDRQFEIARQIVAHHVDVLLGDGRSRFAASTRPDSLDLIAELRADHAWATTPRELRAVAAADSVHALAGFFDIDSVFAADRRSPSLAEMTRAALSVLDRDPQGFFLMVENEHTDHRGHGNAPLEVIAAEVIHIDQAVRVALDYRRTHPETLVIVLGDHETGGLSIVEGADGVPTASWATTHHTLDMIPVFAVGPGAERFHGIQPGSRVGRSLIALVEGAGGG